jgi:hypothetical protein
MTWEDINVATVFGMSGWVYGIVYTWMRTSRVRAVIQIVVSSLVAGPLIFLVLMAIVALIHFETVKEYTVANVYAAVVTLCGCIALLLSLMLYEGKSRSQK